MSNEIQTNLLEEDKHSSVSFEDKIQEAGKLLEKLMDPNITLSDSVQVYKEGLDHLEMAQKLLDEAKLEFKELSEA